MESSTDLVSDTNRHINTPVLHKASAMYMYSISTCRVVGDGWRWTLITLASRFYLGILLWKFLIVVRFSLRFFLLSDIIRGGTLEIFDEKLVVANLLLLSGVSGFLSLPKH
ncbi:hypothetical protein BYT27DRAFT_6499156 [Phlegmacium glaucopus]|nr:hypothetical protein BYT27DRAFT_6499156 [Phlegmacium glaucopus]